MESDLISLVSLPSDQHPLVEAVRKMQVNETDTSFIESNEDMLHLAWNHSSTEALAIVADSTPIGFTVVTMNPSQVWIHSFMIDRGFQGQGWGRRALVTLLKWIDDRCDACCIELASRNPIALSLYRSVGFVEMEDARAKDFLERVGETPLCRRRTERTERNNAFFLQ